MGHNESMKTILNLIWLVFGGFWLALSYFLAGIVCCILIITIPWGIANIKMIPISLMPLGKEIVPSNRPFVSSYH